LRVADGVAVAGLADPIRADARIVPDEVAALGWQVELLSGDEADDVWVGSAARSLGIPPCPAA